MIDIENFLVNILTNILNIINFREDKEIYAREFIKIVNQQVVINLVESLSEDKKDSFIKKAESITTSLDVFKIFNEYFNPTEILAVYTNAFSQEIDDFIQDIKPSLTKKQLEQIQLYWENMIKEIKIKSID